MLFHPVVAFCLLMSAAVAASAEIYLNQ